jgi:mRNA-degrading endonuclease RelE of RelBE toxin-antitoxin system
MHSFYFTQSGKRSFLKLSKSLQKRIIEKLKELKKHPDILSILKQLRGFEPATHRLRIGNYRLILELKKQMSSHCEFWVLDVGHRKDIYL